MPLLSGLDSVDWESYHHAYGPAADVPGLLRALAWPKSADKSILSGAERAKHTIFAHVCWTLWGNVFHQGTRWGVTAQVVPFLRELLVDGPPQVELRRFLVEYLHHLAVGYPDQTFPQPYDLAAVSADAAAFEATSPTRAAVRGDVFGDDEIPEFVGAVWERDSFLAVEACVPDVAQQLGADDTKLALSACALLATFPRKVTESAPALWAQVMGERTDSRRGAALIALAVLGVDISQKAQVLLDQSDGLDALYAACAEVLALGANASPFSWEKLFDVSDSLLQAECPFTGEVSKLVTMCLAKCSREDAPHVVDALLALVSSTKDQRRQGYARAALELAFKTAPEERARVTNALKDPSLQKLVASFKKSK